MLLLYMIRILISKQVDERLNKTYDVPLKN